MDSILQSVRSSMGLDKEDTSFDDELLIFINGSMSILSQIVDFDVEEIEDDSMEWSNVFYDFGDEVISMIKQYVWLSVRILFDPPTGAQQGYLTQLQENLLFRIEIYGEKNE